MTEREEAIALIAGGIRKLGELSEALAKLSEASATISTAARLIAEDLDAVERALTLVGSYLREERPEESDPVMLLQLCQRHIRSLVACIDRMNELNATAELREVAQELTRLGFRASPHEPTGN
jgi:cob(I)alamin adenosyltransferase